MFAQAARGSVHHVKRSIRVVVGLCLTATLWLLFGSGANLGRAWASIAVSTLLLEFQALPGSEQTAILRVANEGERVEKVRVYLQDWDREPDGSHRFYEPGHHPRSLAEWVMVNPVEFALPPHGAQDVQITVSPPPGATGSYWSILMVEGANPSASTFEAGVGVQVLTRYGVKLVETVPGTERREGRITRIQVMPGTEQNPLHVALEFFNSGNSFLQMTGYMEWRSQTGAVIHRQELHPFTALPGERNRVNVVYEGPALAPGRYAVLAAVDYGGPRLVAGQVVLTVTE